MKTIYRSEKGKEAIINLYDRQLSRLEKPWKDVLIIGDKNLVDSALSMG